MTKKQNSLVNELYISLTEDDMKIYKTIVDYLLELGYIPQKQSTKSFGLIFKHKINGKVIAKIAKGSIKVKFFACKNIPDKYIEALYDESVANENKYSMEIPAPQYETLSDGLIMIKCKLACSVCTGGGMRYYYKFPDREIYRCGAYPVLIHDVKANDVDDLKQILFEQHSYFLSIA